MSTENEDDRALSAKIEALPREIEPSRDLWQGIGSTIETKQRARRARRQMFGGLALAAGLALCGFAAIESVMFVKAPAPVASHSPAPSVAPAPAVSAQPAAPKAIVPEEESYRTALAALLPTFDQRKAQLPADDAKKLDASLDAIQAALTATRTALAAHPDDPDLRAELDAEYEQEIQTMNDVLDWTTRS